jgi:hypothetical protein
MTVRAWPRFRAKVIAVAIAGAFAGSAGAVEALAQPSPRRSDAEHPMRRFAASRASNPNAQRAASAPLMRTAAPPGLEEHHRDGHMTPEERRLLRQHIEDAVRELYKR